jgi:acyl-CoA synthetase (AMP-forming)/AMP-acid ligase II
MMLSDALARAARDCPDDNAVVFGDRRLTWSQWHERVQRLTGALAAAGIRRGDRVAVIDRNHLAVLDLILAAGALGAATVVPNWRLKDEELAYILRDSSPRIVLLGEGFAEREGTIRRASSSIERIVHLDDEYESWIAASEGIGASSEASPDDIVLVIYTSGTTGPAKGSMFSHRGIAANAEVSAITADCQPDDRIIVSMPLFHVGGAGSALASILSGVPLTILAETTAQAMTEAIEQGGTRAFLVPAVLSRMLEAGPRESRALASLSLLAYGGAPCPRSILEEALTAMPRTEFVQVYGMTELCGTVTSLPDAAHRDPTHPERLASAGQVIDSVDMRIVDPFTLVDVARGEPGELWFRTAKRMIGYLGQPEATAQMIVEGDWVRTGDIGRIDEDGFIFIIDRLKDLIISGGENIFSPEVEAVLAEHPSVAEAAVIGVPHPTMGESVLAVVVAAPGATIDPEALIAYSREHLAGFKCPRAVEVIDVLPRNASGKVLKRQLRERLQATGEARH